MINKYIKGPKDVCAGAGLIASIGFPILSVTYFLTYLNHIHPMDFFEGLITFLVIGMVSYFAVNALLLEDW